MSIALFSAFCSLMVYTLSICFLTLTLDALSSTATSLKSKEWPVLDTCWNMFELIFFFYTSFLCSSVLSFNYRPVSPTYTALQSLQSILYTTPAWSFVWRLSFNLHISPRSVFVGLWHNWMSYFWRIRAVLSEAPWMYGAHTLFGFVYVLRRPVLPFLSPCSSGYWLAWLICGPFSLSTLLTTWLVIYLIL